jgi:hypothetical protein
MHIIVARFHGDEIIPNSFEGGQGRNIPFTFTFVSVPNNIEKWRVDVAIVRTSELPVDNGIFPTLVTMMCR